MIDASSRVAEGRRQRLAARDGARCFYCECDLEPDSVVATADHVIPACRGGSNQLGNLVLACKPCNTDKGDQLVREWLAVDGARVPAGRRAVVLELAGHLKRGRAPRPRRERAGT